ncbi:MAG: PhnD/SsuA/transferrin family substrate-binding protein [Desulfuromonadales bacterium]|nr:PhnD/SsuA/transferrin family substrate-binding protein [Desulfuromonadales bacterium]
MSIPAHITGAANPDMPLPFKYCVCPSGCMLHWLAALLILVSVFSSVRPAWAEHGKGLPNVFQAGFSSKIFPDMDTRDAKLAMELWAREIAQRAGMSSTQVIIFSNQAEMLTELRRGRLHLVAMPAVEFLRNRAEIPYFPAYVSSNKTGRNMEQLIIVHRKSGIQQVKDLRGRSFAMPNPAKNEAVSLWLDHLLRKNGYADQSDGFRQVKEVSKASQAIMAVFFRQADGCIVSRGSFETSKTMNPQLGKDLLVIAESNSLIGEVTCLPDGISPELKAAIDNAALNAHGTSKGRQILTMFQTERVVPLKNSDLKGVEELLAERGKTLPKPKGRK